MNPEAAVSQALGFEESPILIAEDDPLDVFLLRRAFARADCKAPLYFVNNGSEAIDFLEGNAPFEDRSKFPFPKLLLLDLKMPLLDGLEVLEWLQGRDVRQKLRVVVLSDGAEPAAIKKACALGADSYQQKPNADGLAGLVQNLQRYFTPSAFPGCN